MGDDELPESITIHAIKYPAGVSYDPFDPKNTSLATGLDSSISWYGSNTITNGIVSIAEHTIQGQTIYEELRVVKEQVEDAFGDERQFKELLVKKLVDKMFKSNCIEFTKAEDVYTGEVIFRARIFAVPDTKVRILRESKVI